MGNRGILHSDDQKVVKPWARKAWVTCLLTSDGVRRIPFSKGNYSELFFLDEATSLAAGHRPCNSCRPEKFDDFKRLWLSANEHEAREGFVPIGLVDRSLHEERALPGGGKQTYDAAISELAPWSMFEHDKAAYLIWKTRLLRWSFSGYTPAPSLDDRTIVRVLTPKSIVRMFAMGYAPDIHVSASQ